MPKKPRNPFDVPLTDEQKQTVARWLGEEIQNGLDAKSANDSEVAYWWRVYEQARTRTGRRAPWEDAADLTTSLAGEKVDAIIARGMRTIWTDPIWTVEGWGDAAERAPIVEEIHQWKAEEERLQGYLDSLWQYALVEPRGLMEVYEGTEYRAVRKQINAAIQTDPLTGGLIYDDTGQPQVQRDEKGEIVEAQGDQMAAVMVIDALEPVRRGPCYRLIPYRDSVILPGHARDKQEIWGTFKRFWKKLPEIQRAAMGPKAIYDDDAVESLTNNGDREPNDALTRSGMDVAPQHGVTAEKELWEGLVLIDLDALCMQFGMGKVKPELRGARWYLVTLHLDQRLLLRIQHDDIDRSRFLPLILFPRADRATEGYSLVGHKLITTCEEHTAWRNMAADRAAMVVQAPVKRMQGALWDPEEQPWAPRAVIDVRNMQEIEPMEVPDVNAAVFQHIQLVERNAERIVGVNDIATGQVSQETRTLGEVQMATEQAFVRMDLIIRRFQEFLEDLFQIRHVIWKRTLAEKPDGVEAPASLLGNLEGRGVSIDQFLPDRKITAALFEGAFRGKPRGSVDNADRGKQRVEFAEALKILPMLIQTFPMLGPMFASPQAARAMGRQFLYLWNIPNQQAFLGSPAQDLMQQQQVNMLPPAPAMPPPPMGMGQPGMGGEDPIPALAQQLAAKLGRPPAGLLAQGPQRPQ